MPEVEIARTESGSATQRATHSTCIEGRKRGEVRRGGSARDGIRRRARQGSLARERNQLVKGGARLGGVLRAVRADDRLCELVLVQDGHGSIGVNEEVETEIDEGDPRLVERGRLGYVAIPALGAAGVIRHVEDVVPAVQVIV